MTTPTSGSSRARSNASDSSNRVVGRKAFRTSGRAIMTLAIPSPTSYLMSSYSPDRCHCTIGPTTPRASTRTFQASLSHMPSPTTPDIRAGDLVAVTLPPGQDWAGIVRKVWEAGGALFPVDHRLPASLARDLMERAVPTIVVDADGWHRAGSGRPIGDGVALVVHTSGTGGVPKLVQFDRPAIDAAVASSTLALEVSPHDRWLCCLPLAHVGGLLVLLRSVLLGAPITVHPRFDGDRCAQQDRPEQHEEPPDVGQGKTAQPPIVGRDLQGQGRGGHGGIDRRPVELDELGDAPGAGGVDHQSHAVSDRPARARPMPPIGIDA